MHFIGIKTNIIQLSYPLIHFNSLLYLMHFSCIFFYFFSNFISSIAMFFIERNCKSYTPKVQKTTGNTATKATGTRTQNSSKSTIDDEHIQQGLKIIFNLLLFMFSLLCLLNSLILWYIIFCCFPSLSLQNLQKHVLSGKTDLSNSMTIN